MALGRLHDQRGAGFIGCTFMILLAAGAIYAGVMLGGPRFKNSAFSDRLNEAMPLLERQPEEDIRKQVIQMAQEFEIDLKPEQIQISTERARLQIRISYEKFVDLKAWQTTLRFDLHREGPPPQ